MQIPDHPPRSDIKCLPLLNSLATAPDRGVLSGSPTGPQNENIGIVGDCSGFRFDSSGYALPAAVAAIVTVRSAQEGAQ